MVVSPEEHRELIPTGWPWTHCIRGHLFEESNTYIDPSGRRQCRICAREKARRLKGNSSEVPARSKTQCVRGHPFDEANTYIKPNGRRRCRTCQRQSYKAWYERKYQRVQRPRRPRLTYQEKRARMTPEQIAAFRARAAFNALERRRRDPEKIRALECAKRVRRLARDPEGYRAKRRAIARRYEKKRQRGVHVELVF